MSPPARDGEARLAELLELLRRHPPRSDPGLTRSVVRTARWQHAVRGPLRAVGLLAASLADGAALLARRRPRDRREDER